jgi:archaellum component FlaC
MKDEFATRYDLIAFGGAFVIGLLLYVVLHVVAQVHQAWVMFAILAVMITYSVIAARLPIVRVRLDQAGDNAYYLGLLFTLTSMAFALYEFGAATSSARAGESAGPRQIIENFGIALASTIGGIFLRVILQQMRADPADLEHVTRIELAEASKRVKASVENVTIELGRFHSEVRQRSDDIVRTLFEETKQSAMELHTQVKQTTSTMLDAVAQTHKSALDQTHEMTRELASAVARLRTVEPPPTTLSKRLDKVASVLQTAGDHTEGIVTSLQHIAEAAETSSNKIQEAATLLKQVAEQVEKAQTASTERLTGALGNIETALTTSGERLDQHLKLSVQLEEQSRRAAAEAVRAQSAAVEVLNRLTDVAKGLANVLRETGKGARA